MAITYINTDKLRDINDNINHLVQDYYREINSMFTKFSNVPDGTHEWVGETSEKYFQEIGLEKNDYIAFGQNLSDFNQAISKTIEQTELSLIKTNNVEKGA